MSNQIAMRDKKIIEARRQFFEVEAPDYLNPGVSKRYYNKRMLNLLKFNIPPEQTILELGCGTGDLLANLEPSRGVGIDFSETLLETARARHPELEFRVADVHELTLESDETFDVILLSNLVGDLIDVQRVLAKLPAACHERTRIIITHYNYLWGPLVKLAEKLGIKPRQREQNWLEVEDLSNLLELVDIETVKNGRDILAPLPIPLVSELINDFIATLPGISRLNLNSMVVGRKRVAEKRQDYKVSVIVACKDERGNIEELVRTTPKMGLGTEMVFVDGHSEDGTVEEIERCISIFKELNPELDDVRVYTQPGKGKGDAVRLGFDEAKGDVLMILDADITVRPEDLPKFYDALAEGKGEFINGSRLVYPMEDQAMRFLNMLANHLFGWTFSYLLDQRLTDTLCGTKVLFKRDYESIEKGRTFFGDFDPFGDFDLLFGAAKLNLKIKEIPIRYRNREYGNIKISRFRHGLLLAKMSLLAFQRFKLHRGA
jgi:SAM-dependent methyltransferase